MDTVTRHVQFLAMIILETTADLGDVVFRALAILPKLVVGSHST